MENAIEAADQMVKALTEHEARLSQEVTNAVSNGDLGRAKVGIQTIEETQVLRNDAEKLKAGIAALSTRLMSPIRPNDVPVRAFTPEHRIERDGRKQDRTDPVSMNDMRKKIIRQLEVHHSIQLSRQSPAIYRSRNNTIGIVCAISKCYPSGGYWYAFHQYQDEYLASAGRGFFVLGMMDLLIAVALPLEVLRENLDKFNTTTTPDGRRTYWHIRVSRSDNGGLLLQRARGEPPLALEPYVLEIVG
jgi:hypothetical protein